MIPSQHSPLAFGELEKEPLHLSVPLEKLPPSPQYLEQEKLFVEKLNTLKTQNPFNFSPSTLKEKSKELKKLKKSLDLGFVGFILGLFFSAVMILFTLIGFSYSFEENAPDQTYLIIGFFVTAILSFWTTGWIYRRLHRIDEKINCLNEDISKNTEMDKSIQKETQDKIYQVLSNSHTSKSFAKELISLYEELATGHHSQFFIKKLSGLLEVIEEEQKKEEQFLSVQQLKNQLKQ